MGLRLLSHLSWMWRTGPPSSPLYASLESLLSRFEGLKCQKLVGTL